MPSSMDCKVYVGDLGSNASKHELDDIFSDYGRLRNVWVARNPPGFAFVEFEDDRDAEDAVNALDGRTICGRRAKVQLSNGKSRANRGPPPRRGRPFHPEDRCYECGERGHYARDCNGSSRSRRRSRSRSRSPRRRSYSRSRSRSASYSKRSRDSRDRGRSYSRSKSRDVSADRGSKGRSHSRGRSRSRSYTPPRRNGY